MLPYPLSGDLAAQYTLKAAACFCRGYVHSGTTVTDLLAYGVLARCELSKLISINDTPGDAEQYIRVT